MEDKKGSYQYLDPEPDISGYRYQDSLFGNIHIGDITNTYPNNPDYEYETYIELINFDNECKMDIESGNGFIVEPSKGIKNNQSGIFR